MAEAAQCQKCGTYDTTVEDTGLCPRCFEAWRDSCMELHAELDDYLANDPHTKFADYLRQTGRA